MRGRVYIFRGLPGSGKSTRAKRDCDLAKALDLSTSIVSADNHFIKNGVYRFNAGEIAVAHYKCFRAFGASIADGVQAIFIDNTNTRLREFERYILLAEESDYKVTVIRMAENDPIICASRNLHGVPLGTIIKMKNRFQDYPGEKIV